MALKMAYLFSLNFHAFAVEIIERAQNRKQWEKMDSTMDKRQLAQSNSLTNDHENAQNTQYADHGQNFW